MSATRQTEQIGTWTGDFGREYTDRNTYTPGELDELYRRNYGVTRSEMNRRFLGDIPRDARILEVGCNIGTQLLLLKEMGFSNLSGIEIQSYAIAQASRRLPEVEFRQASALNIPYPDHSFDLVFTSGVLIHIAPSELPIATREIDRCAKTWIWGFEYYAPEMTEVAYRGQQSLLWKADYARMYQEIGNLELVREERFKYLSDSNVDTAFLLRRRV